MESRYRLRKALTVVVTDTPTITAGIYSANDAVGGLITFTNAVSPDLRTGTIQAFILIDDGLQSDATELHLFDRAFTPTADNAAFAPSDADLLNHLGYVELATGDYTDFATNSVGFVKNQKLPFVLNGTSLFGQLVTRGTPTYTATDDLTVKLVIIQD